MHLIFYILIRLYFFLILTYKYRKSKAFSSRRRVFLDDIFARAFPIEVFFWYELDSKCVCLFFFFYHFSFSLNSITRFGPSSAAGRKTNSCLARNAKMASAWPRWRHDEYERATHRNRASVLGFRNDQQRIRTLCTVLLEKSP